MHINNCGIKKKQHVTKKYNSDDSTWALVVGSINVFVLLIQINGNVPTVSIDKTDGCQVFFPNGVGDTEIVTAKSSEMNIMVPKPGSQDLVSEGSSRNPFLLLVKVECIA